MVVTPFRLFLFVLAFFLAAGGTAYYTGALNAYFAPADRQIVQQEGQGAAESGTTDGAEPSDTAKAEAPNEDAASESKSESASEQEDVGKKTDRVVVPAFDIVRVEPDGSMVVAGRAAPKSNVEVISGSTIIGKAQSGPDGDFAVVLDEPLKPGNYQIVLRATSPRDVVATSRETAVVSVPDSENGEVLALVEEPGKPSRLITKPAAGKAGAAEDVATDGNVAAPKSEIAAEAVKDADSQAPAEGKVEQDQSRVAGTEPTESADKDADVTDNGSSKQAEQTGKAQEPGRGAASGAPTDENPGISAPEDAAAPAGEAAQEMAHPTTNGSAAVNEASQVDKDSERSDRDDAKVFIEAVEIDGKDIFVAGGGVPGQRVRVYANDMLLGDAVVSPNGRFLVQASRELPVGDYIVRADLLSDNGSEVIARAAVPFERAPGEKLAAVAPKSGSDSAPEETAIKNGPAGDASAEDKSEHGTTAPQAPSSPPKGEAGMSAPASALADDGESASASSGAASSGSSTQEPAPTAETEGGMELPDLHNGLAENAPVVTGPKLESVEGAVIIRRGDTLWQISRRVYGRGVRYSTIYLANQQQIRNPDLIWPGQVFSVPQETKDGETADMKAIGEQAVPADMAGTEPEWRR